MAELVKPKRRKPKVKERPPVPIRYEKAEDVIREDSLQEDSIKTTVNTATVESLSEAIETTEFFESTEALSQTNVAVVVEDTRLETENTPCDNVTLPDEKCISEVAPTAPLASFDVGFFVDSVLRKKDPVEKKSEVQLDTRMIDFINSDITQEISKNFSKEKVVPFSEKELSAFYVNEETFAAVDVMKEFSSKPVPAKDELFHLLQTYCDLRQTDRKICQRLDEQEIKLKQSVSNLWTVWPEVVFTQRGKCGHDTDVIFTHTYQQARLNSEEFPKLQELVANRMKFIKSKWSSSVATELHKILIRVNIWTLQKNCSHLIAKDSLLMNITRDAVAQECVDRLSQALGTLFYFLRKVPRNFDEEFFDDVRNYLGRVLGTLVRIGGWREHLLILAHILCCPPGVALWAVPYVQCPKLNADHACALLSVLLWPVASRHKFLEHRLGDGQWSMVDEDGLDLDSDCGAVCETVLLELLDQVERWKCWSIDCWLSNLLMALYGFYEFVFQVPLQNALENYLIWDEGLLSEFSFLKLLGFCSKIVNIIHGGLASYNNENYRQLSKKLGKWIRNIWDLVTDQLEFFLSKNDSSPRIQVEYDEFCLRTAKTLLSQPSVWQFLATAPFNKISKTTRWKIFLEIIQPRNNILQEEDHKRDKCHLITTLCHLALAPGVESQKLVQLVAFHIFNVGFVHPEEWDSCYKDAQSCLSTLAAQNTHLFDELFEVNAHFFDQKILRDESTLIGLWQALPIEQWIPNEHNLKIVSQWLGSAVSDTRNEIARGILLRLNYGEISYAVQKEIAWMLLRGSQCNAQDPHFTKICLGILCRLRLHLVDRNDLTLMDIPDASKFAELGSALSANSCTAAFLALQMTSIGHFVPVIFTDGFKLIRVLYDGGYYDAAFLCLDHLVTMFWDCPDSLTSCKDFLSLLGDIVTSDGLYTKFVKFISRDEAFGPVLQKFTLMMVNHLQRGGVEFLPKSVALWVRVITSLPMWQACLPAVFLLNGICKQAFSNPNAWLQIMTILEEILPKADCVPVSSPMSYWLGFRKLPPMPSLLTDSFGKYAPWFAYAAISIEFDAFEFRNGLWNHLLQEVWDSRGQKNYMDQILKKLCSQLKLRVRSANELAFYRWLNLAIVIPDTHPLTIMIWQKLMELYLSRVPGLGMRGCPGDYFLNQTLKLQLIDKLKALEKSQTNLATVFQNITLWLKSPEIKDANLLVAMLPEQYNPPLLASVLNKETHLWIAMLPLPKMNEEIVEMISKWLNLFHRQAKRTPVKINSESEPAVLRIQKRLAEFSDPKKLPDLIFDKPFITIPSLNNPDLIDLITMWIISIEQFLTSWNEQWKLVTQAEKLILRNAGLLYESKEQRITKSQKCDDRCKTPATMVLNLVIWTKDELRSNSFALTMENFLKNYLVVDIPESVPFCCGGLRYLAKMMEKEVSCKDTGFPVKFFEKLCELWSKAEPVQPGIATLVKKCIMTLGKKHILRNPACIESLLLQILAMPKATFLQTLFNPINTKQGRFVEIYKLVLENMNDTSLIQKFDVQHWMKDSLPENQSDLITVIFTALRMTSDPKQLNDHLQILIRHSFPTNFGQVLEELFQSGAKITPDTWYAVLNALSPNGLTLEQFDLADIFEFSDKFAVQQTALKLSLLQLVITNFVTFSADIRITKKQSLYEHYGRNAQSLVSFLAVVVKSAIVIVNQSAEQQQRVLDVIKVEEIFAPWLVPYLSGHDDIQQPFAANFAASAGYVAALFVDLVRFLIKNLPAYENPLNFALRFYLRHFCNARVDGLVLSVIHSSLVSLPWYDVRLTLLDLDTILLAMNQTIPLCHNFLGNICASLKWVEILSYSSLETSSEMNTRFHVCLLHLLIRIRAIASFKNNKAVDQLLNDAAGFSWQLVDAQSYHSACSVFSLTMNPDVILEDLGPETYDPRILRLLQSAAGYEVGLVYFHPETPQKRIIFVSTVIRSLATAACNAKRPLKPRLISKLISRLLTDIEIIVSATVPEFQKVHEASALLIEVLKCLSETKLSANVEEAVIEWLKVTDAKLVITSLFQCSGRCIENPIFYGAITEAAIESYFANTGLRDWQWLMHILIPYTHGSVQHVLNSNSYYLTFCVYSLQILRTEISRNQLTMVLQIFGTLKPNEDLEPKFVLLMALALTMIPNESDAPVLLQSFSDTLMGLAADRGTGLFSAIVGKLTANSFSVKFKLCCAILVSGIRNVLLVKYKHSSDDKSQQFLEKAEKSKTFLPVMPCLLNAKKDLPTLTEMSQIVHLLLTTADQLFGKNYFTGFDSALHCLKK